MNSFDTENPAYKNEVEETEVAEEINLENILNHLNVISNKLDRKEISIAIRMILDFCDEAGNRLTDVRKLLFEINDNY